MKKSRIYLFIVLLFVFAANICAATVDTVLVKSNSMNKKVQVVVIAPDGTKNKEVSYPVVYLLHGYSGNAKSWLEFKNELPQIAQQYKMIIVCPDAKNSWYWDSPKKPSYRYETFVGDELLNFVDSHYPTIKDRKGRAITGLSMGGHGALWLACRHKDKFGAVGSTSGGVDIRPFGKNNWEIKSLLGDYETDNKLWEDHTAISQISKISQGDLAIIIDCGVDDFFLEVNKNLHQCLLDRKIDHDFILRPGQHNGKYWNNSIDYQLLFFHKFFQNK